MLIEYIDVNLKDNMLHSKSSRNYVIDCNIKSFIYLYRVIYFKIDKHPPSLWHEMRIDAFLVPKNAENSQNSKNYISIFFVIKDKTFVICLVLLVIEHDFLNKSYRTQRQHKKNKILYFLQK